MNYLWKLKQLKEDIVCLNQPVCLKFMGCQLQHYILQAVLEITIRLPQRTQSLENHHIQVNFIHRCILIRIPMEAEEIIRQVFIPSLTNELC